MHPYLPKLLIVQFPQELILCLVDNYSCSQFLVFCELVSYLYCSQDSEIVSDYLVLLDTT